MAVDQKVVELQKSLQKAGYNTLSQSGSMDSATRAAIADINKKQGYGAGIGASALTSDTQKWISNAASAYDAKKSGSSSSSSSSSAPKTYDQQVSDAYSGYKAPSAPNNANIYSQMSQALNDMYANQEKARLAQLEIARNKALGSYNNQKTDAENNYGKLVSGLNLQKEQAKPKYVNARNDADAQSMVSAQRLRERMASMGLINSGDNQTANTDLMVARQNALNNVDNQELAFNQDIEGQISNANADKTAQLNKIAQAIADLQANGATEDAAALAELAGQKMQAQYGMLQSQADNTYKDYGLAYQAAQDNLKNSLDSINTRYKMAQDAADRAWQQSPDNPANIYKEAQAGYYDAKTGMYVPYTQSQIDKNNAQTGYYDVKTDYLPALSQSQIKKNNASANNTSTNGISSSQASDINAFVSDSSYTAQEKYDDVLANPGKYESRLGKKGLADLKTKLKSILSNDKSKNSGYNQYAE